jgi:hypothetical protein
LPPVTPLTLSVTDSNAGGAFGSAPTSIQNDLVTPPAFASMRADVEVRTGSVVMLKLFALLPSVIETLAGTCTTEGLSVLNATTPPPAGAGITSPTVPRAELPPMSALGRTSNAKTVGDPAVPGRISSNFACDPPVVPYLA